MVETERIASSPVHRLRDFIIAGRGEVSKTNIIGKKFIAQRIDADAKDAIQIYQGFLMALNLVRQSKLALDATSNPMKIPCLSALIRIGDTLGSTNLDQPWQSTNSKIPEGDVDLLKIGETILEQETYELLLFDAEVQEFDESINQVALEIKSSELPDEVKAALSDLLDDVSRGLKNYQRYGLDGLKEALATAYGKVVLESATISPHKKEPTLEKVWAIFKDINTAISIVGKSTAAGKIASDAIERILGS